MLCWYPRLWWCCSSNVKFLFFRFRFGHVLIFAVHSSLFFTLFMTHFDNRFFAIPCNSHCRISFNRMFTYSRCGISFSLTFLFYSLWYLSNFNSFYYLSSKRLFFCCSFCFWLVVIIDDGFFNTLYFPFSDWSRHVWRSRLFICCVPKKHIERWEVFFWKIITFLDHFSGQKWKIYW